MNDAPRRTLRELIDRHGTGLCSDARRCEGLLRDLCGGHRREINILVGALRERVPLDLLAGRNSVPAGLLLTRLAKRLEDQLALTEEASSWGVDSWALALGVVTDAELEGLKSRRGEATGPRREAAKGPTPAPASPAAEGEQRAGKPAASAAARPTASAGTQNSPTSPATRTPAASNPPSPLPRQAPSSLPKARGGANAPAPQQTAARAPSTIQTANTGGLQKPAGDPAPRGRRRWRGCLVGCFLILLLSALLLVAAPFVFDILRDEQQRMNPEPPPVQTR